MWLGRHGSLQEAPLEATRTSQVYRARLLAGSKLLNRWLQMESLDTSQWWEERQQANQVLANFVQDMHNKRLAKPWLVRHALLAAQYQHHQLRHHIQRPWDALKSWELKEPFHSRTAVPLEILQAFFIMCVNCAVEHPAAAQSFLMVAIISRLVFFGTMRIGEGLNAFVKDIKVCISNPSIVLCAIVNPKNKSAHGRVQYAVAKDLGLARWIQWMLDGVSSHRAMWEASHATFRRYWVKVMKMLMISGLMPGGLRGGHATHLLMNGFTTGRIMELGRWRCHSSLSRYLQEVMVSLIWDKLEAGVAQGITSINTTGQHIWEHPPFLSWSAFLTKLNQDSLPSSKRQRLSQP